MQNTVQFLSFTQNVLMYREFTESLKGFLAELEETRVGDRRLASVTFDVRAGKVDLVFEDAEPNVHGSLLAAYESETEGMKREWQANFERWQKRHYGAITRADYQERADIELRELLNSAFLMPEDDMLNKEKLAKATAELEKKNLPVVHAAKYALMCDLLKNENGIFSFDETDRLELYIEDNEFNISKKNVVALLRFKFAMNYLTPYLHEETQDEQTYLSTQDQALQKRILGYVSHGDWQMPATFDNVRAWLSTLFGGDTAGLDEEDVEKTRAFRDFFKGGRAGEDTDRVELSMANILGYLMSYQLLAGGQKQISTEFFGNDGQVNNINKGKNGEGSQAFKNLIPLMDKYRVRVIV